MSRSNRTPTRPLKEKTSHSRGVAVKNLIKPTSYDENVAPVKQAVATPAVQRRVVGKKRPGNAWTIISCAILKGVPKSKVYRIVRSGEVRVNGGRCQPDQRLVEGDQLRFTAGSLPSFSEESR